MIRHPVLYTFVCYICLNLAGLTIFLMLSGYTPAQALSQFFGMLADAAGTGVRMGR